LHARVPFSKETIAAAFENCQADASTHGWLLSLAVEGPGLRLVTALVPLIGYDKASKISHYAMDNDLTLKDAALQLGFVTEAEFDRLVDPRKMVEPYVAIGG
jgi:fumarate hydratase class II